METNGSIILSFESLEIGFRSGNKANILLPPLKAATSEGELIAVIGKNGIGKSTLLRTLAGLQPVLKGYLKIYGLDINTYSRIRLSANVGYISTEIVRISNMKVYDLVSLGRFPHTNWFGTQNRLDTEAVEEAIIKAGITAFSHRQLSEISDGERQRAMIAMVLAQDAGIMIMDEPTAFLDISSRYEIIHLMHELTGKRGKTIVFSTHDLDTAINQADKIWLLSGRGLVEGAPEDLMIKGSFKDLFDDSKVRFNESDASFSVVKGFKGNINLKGEGSKRFWTEKALLRVGYQVTDNKSAVMVETPDERRDFWRCRIEDDMNEFNSVYELVAWLRKENTIS
jgi:iron complex transport system ATP-binding protein